MHTHKLVDWYLLGDSPERMAAVAGIDRSQGNDTLKAIVPLLVTAIAEHAEHPEGQQQILEAIHIIPRYETVKEALDIENGIEKLQRAGARIAPTLLGEKHATIAERISRRTGAKEKGVKHLIEMALTLLLGRLGYQEASSTSLLPLLLGTGAIVLNNDTEETAEDTGQISTLEHRRRGIPLWLMMSLPLLFLGGCLYMNRDRLSNQFIDGSISKSSGIALPTRHLVVSYPPNGSEVYSHDIHLKGTGPIGKSFSIWRATRKLGRFTVDKSGNWELKLKGPTAWSGEVVYAFKDEKSQSAGQHLIQLKRELEILNPKSGESAPSAGFLISGVGKKAGETYQVFENGTSIGSFIVDKKGNWKINVPAANPGLRTYLIVNKDNQKVSSLQLNIKQVKTGQNCVRPMSISMTRDQKVDAPFRFGGAGHSGQYVVTVWRGQRKVGIKYVGLRNDCTWNYFSDPGGQKGKPQLIRYEVRPVDSVRQEIKKLALTVMGSGSNYDQYGRYIGPRR